MEQKHGFHPKRIVRYLPGTPILVYTETVQNWSNCISCIPRFEKRLPSYLVVVILASLDIPTYHNNVRKHQNNVPCMHEGLSSNCIYFPTPTFAVLPFHLSTCVLIGMKSNTCAREDEKRRRELSVFLCSLSFVHFWPGLGTIFQSLL